jgi:hypothetical protein
MIEQANNKAQEILKNLLRNIPVNKKQNDENKTPQTLSK